MTEPRVSARRGRAARRQSTAVKHFDAAWRNWRNPYPPIEQFSADEIEAIHDASMKVLRDIGIKVLSDEARGFYVSAGMRDAGDQVAGRGVADWQLVLVDVEFEI